ncbi:MAG: hypothetical protein ACON4Z_02080 [Planctomycetota bacterium]
MHRHLRHLGLTILALCGGLSAQLSWQPSLEAARAAAAERNQPMLVAILVPGERDSDALLQAYRDANLRKLASNVVCLRIDVVSERGDEDRLAVVERYLGAPPREPFVAPHHVLVAPDGETVISSAAHRMTVGQLEWFIGDGLRKLDSSFRWPRSDRMRAPADLRYEERETTEQELLLPPSRKKVKAAIDALKKGGAGWQGAIENYTTLLTSDERAAVKYVDTQLSGGRGMITGIVLSTVSRLSPLAYAPMLEEFLDNRRSNRRREAAVGLWQMAPKKSKKAIFKQLKREDDAEARGWLLRAAVAVAPKDKASVAAIERALKKDDEAFVRAQAAVAAGALELRDESLRLMRRALNDGDPDVRAAAGFAMAARRDQELLGALEPSVRSEPDAETKRWLELAMTVLSQRGDLAGFERLRRKILKEPTRGLPDMGRGRNRGGGGGQAGGGQAGGGG